MFTLPPDVTDLIIQSVVFAAWQRPELAALREPIEATLKADTFRTLTGKAFETLATNSQAALPQFFDQGFITMPAVQETLAAYIVKGDPADSERLAELYARRQLKPTEAPHIEAQLTGYLKTLRETFATDPTYGPILLARDVQSMAAALNNLRGETQADFAEVIARLDALLQEPEIKALVERKQGTHIFLSYSRKNMPLALKIRNAMEDAGHSIWQDVSAIKGGDQWLDSIDDGIKRAYAVVIVLSAPAWESYWVREEFAHAQRHGKRIIPLNIDGRDTPFGMNQLNPIDAHTDFEAGLRHLLAALPTPARETPAAPAPADRRQLELDYLNRLLLEHSVWQTVYTPMAGVAQIRQERPTDKPKMVTVPCSIDSKFRHRLHQSPLAVEPVTETRQREYDDILPAVAEYRQLVILGDPGAGKTTTLWAIAAHAAARAKDEPAAPLPVFVRLGELGQGQTLASRIQAQLGDLAPFYEALLAEKRLLFLLDGLNEMPAEGRAENVAQIKSLAERCHTLNLMAAITCRELDYTGTLDLRLPEKIVITPLDPPRIHRFVNGYFTEPSDAGERLFWLLAGEYAEQRWQQFSRQVGESFETFWLAADLPEGKRWDWGSNDERYKNTYWKDWLEQRRQPRSLLQLATNPFMLYMMTQVYTEEGQLPPNRGALFALFTNFLLLDREGLDEAEAAALADRLADLAFAMQAQGEGTTFSKSQVLHYLTDERDLYRARSASLLAGSEDVRFTHQLLQEYFAARRLDRELQQGVPASRFWPSETWWQPNGWNETAVLLAGLYSNNTTPVIEWLRDANPELAARCILESGAGTPSPTIEALRPRWLPRLTDLQTDPQPEGRAAIGRALAILNLDNRSGVGLRYDGLPDIAWGRAVPPGIYTIGGDEQTYNALPSSSMRSNMPTSWRAIRSHTFNSRHSSMPPMALVMIAGGKGWRGNTGIEQWQSRISNTPTTRVRR